MSIMVFFCVADTELEVPEGIMFDGACRKQTVQTDLLIIPCNDMILYVLLSGRFHPKLNGTVPTDP